MIPNFHDFDYLFVERVSYYFRQPERGEVLVFRFPRNEQEYFIKRLIGLPGEHISIHDDVITVTTGEGKIVKLREHYIPSATLTEGDVEVTLKADEYYVLGDNRSYSFDSRQWGVLPKKDIIGKVFVRVWPLTKAQAFSTIQFDLTS